MYDGHARRRSDPLFPCESFLSLSSRSFCRTATLATMVVTLACRSADESRRAADSGASTSAATRDSVEVIRVNTGPHGMAAHVRWMLPSDGHAILAMEDPAGVEAEPVLNGFVFASEPDGIVLHVDGVWDVAPSPDWSALAIGRGFVLRGGETDTIPDAEWTRLERWLPEDVAAPSIAALRRELRPHLFTASGMAYAWGLGLAQVLDLSRFGPGRAPVVIGPTVALDGWRVRWTRSGDSVAAGAAPVRIEDHASPTKWTVVRADARDHRGSRRTLTDSSSLVPVKWIEGPTIDISAPIDISKPTVLDVAAARIESRNGVITWTPRGGSPTSVGPGLPLAATGSGIYILALAPRAGADTEPKVEVILYAIHRSH
jgi:hypothetical protein